MGNGIWTTEIIPAEIQPPARSVAGASGNRIRIGSQARHQRRRRDRPRGGLQRAGAARPRAGRRAQARRAPSCWRACGASTATRRSSRPTSRPSSALRQAGYKVVRGPDGAASAARWSPTRASGKNMFVLGHAVQHLQPRPEARRASRSRCTFGKKDAERHRGQRRAARGRPRLGRGQPRLQVPHPGDALDRAADRGQRQHRAGAGRARLGHGHLRDVPDHAGHLGLALPVRGVREGRRHRAPGRGRDRRLRLRHRRLLCRQVRGHHHLRPGLFAQAGGASGWR